MPIGRSPKPSGTFSGAIDATGMASSLGKIANGSLSTTTSVESFGRREPLDRGGLAVGELLGAEDRVERPAATAAHLGVEHALPARQHLACDERRPVGERDAAAQVERVGQPVGRRLPARGERGDHLRVGGEAREPVEQVGDRAAGGHVGGEGRVERAGIVVVARVDEGAPIRASAAPAAGRGEEREEQGEGTTHDVLA